MRQELTGTETSQMYPKYGVPTKYGGMSWESITLIVTVAVEVNT